MSNQKPFNPAEYAPSTESVRNYEQANRNERAVLKYKVQKRFLYQLKLARQVFK